MKNSILKDIGLAFLRMGAAAMMITHGLPKFQKLVSGNLQFADPIGIGSTPSLILTVLAEFVCPILIFVGFKTRLASVPVVITMLVAGLIVHASDPFKTKEMALLYALIFITILVLGPGKYSLDRK
ncbi:putative oxidoreductase [Arenibacter nanhaiticus]|uniref:Putative oxidoreductase n=1 Tax=Arenibacter nanhaiticus TaxID=558155 RepID=A0A1M6DTB8_9FLAO|nr:DoxX family protein [Arenibacter nanhaiticus]SHI76507.1 putative oxidoreductase [Arenibacter nanhaiticus]